MSKEAVVSKMGGHARPSLFIGKAKCVSTSRLIGYYDLRESEDKPRESSVKYVRVGGRAPVAIDLKSHLFKDALRGTNTKILICCSILKATGERLEGTGMVILN